MLIEPGILEIRDVPVPKVPKDGALVRVRAALTCGTDLKGYLRGHAMMPMPGPLGHEYAGDILELGPDAPPGFSVGMAIMGVHSAPCNRCAPCLRGQENLCESIMDTKVLGAYAEVLAIPGRILSQNCFPKPDHLLYEKAAFLEPLACAVHGQNLVPMEDAKSVCVFGAGPIGLLHLLLAKAKGIEKLIVVEPSANRRSLAESLGAVVIDPVVTEPQAGINEITEGRRADLVIECTAREEVWSAALLATRPGGWAVMFGGLPSGSTPCFDADHLHYKEVRLVGSFHFTPGDVQKAQELLVKGEIDPEPLISGRYPLEELEKALIKLKAGDGIKYLIEPGRAQ